MGTMFCLFTDAPVNAAEKEPFTPLGAPSCASAACHNQNLGKGIPFSEYTTWTGFDPHHKAYESLFSPRSDRMVKNLYNTGAGSAASTQLCLNCHSSNQGKSEHAGLGFTLTEGVGCESCHGASSGYISIHFTEKFKKLSSQEKEKEHGLTNTKDLSSRNKMCADCHVGNATRPCPHTERRHCIMHLCAGGARGCGEDAVGGRGQCAPPSHGIYILYICIEVYMEMHTCMHICVHIYVA